MHNILKEIRNRSAAIIDREISYDLRRRLNPHHPAEIAAYERKTFEEQSYTEFAALKKLYVLNKEILLAHPELTIADRETFRSLEACVTDDLERELDL